MIQYKNNYAVYYNLHKEVYTYAYCIVFIYKPCQNSLIYFIQPFAFIILFFNLFFQYDPTSLGGTVSETPVP